jgi:hypothetical protein
MLMHLYRRLCKKLSTRYTQYQKFNLSLKLHDQFKMKMKTYRISWHVLYFLAGVAVLGPVRNAPSAR